MIEGGLIAESLRVGTNLANLALTRPQDQQVPARGHHRRPGGHLDPAGLRRSRAVSLQLVVGATARRVGLAADDVAVPQCHVLATYLFTFLPHPNLLNPYRRGADRQGD